MAPWPVRILLVDDHTLFRSGLRALVTSLRGLEVVGEAGDGREALGLVPTVRPDVVLMDISMPELNGIEATRLLLDGGAGPRVLAISMHCDRGYVSRMLAAGASGYVLKTASPEELHEAILRTARGQQYVTPEVGGSGRWARGARAILDDPL